MQDGQYHINPIELNGSYTLPDLMAIIRENASIYFKRGSVFSDASSVKDYLQSAIGCEESECFGVLFLDNKHRLIEFKILFYGTIDSANVHPREVVKQAIKYNASAVILCHNHPSGITKPSNADIVLTEKLKQALAIIDIRVLDHIIVGDGCTSLIELGKM